MQFPAARWLVLWLVLAPCARACELCAIYNANAARGEASSGFLLTLSAQYVPMDTVQFKGQEFEERDPDYVNSLYTHVVPTYNFSERFGVSFNLPVIYRNYQQKQLLYGSFGTMLKTNRASESGIGDAVLVGRYAVLLKSEMEWGVTVNLLGGVKFPTGNSDALDEEVAQVEAYNKFVGPGHPHDVLGNQVSGVHLSDIALGSGSFDGVFGLTVNSRYRRWFLNALFQYYLRTEGTSGYQYGNEIMVSGGPGAYVLLNKRFTLTLQLNAGYDYQAKDKLFGQPSNNTGMKGWYLGPIVGFSWGGHFNTQAGVDIPITIYNNGLQNVPTYRVQGGVNWSF